MANREKKPLYPLKNYRKLKLNNLVLPILKAYNSNIEIIEKNGQFYVTDKDTFDFYKSMILKNVNLENDDPDEFFDAIDSTCCHDKKEDEHCINLGLFKLCVLDYQKGEKGFIFSNIPEGGDRDGMNGDSMPYFRHTIYFLL